MDVRAMLRKALRTNAACGLVNDRAVRSPLAGRRDSDALPEEGG